MRRIVGNVKLTFEELTTMLTQIEACLNSRPLVAMPNDNDGVKPLTPGHFLIGHPLESLPDPSFPFVTCPFCVNGIYVKHLFGTFGHDGHMNMSSFIDDSLSGIVLLETSMSVT